MKANQYIREIEVYFKIAENNQKQFVKSSKDAYSLFTDMENLTQEKVVALHLAADGSINCFQVVHIGTINEAICNPADILRTALLTGAISLIIIHNHPGGSIKPSNEDRELLQALKHACKLFQISLLDFMIIGDNSYYSATDHSELKDLY